VCKGEKDVRTDAPRLVMTERLIWKYVSRRVLSKTQWPVWQLGTNNDKVEVDATLRPN
jgi:hypothetical protein